MVPKWRFLRPVSFSEPRAARLFHTCILNLHEGHAMRGSMVDIQSATAEIGEEYEKDRKKERTRMWAIAHRDGRPAEYRWEDIAVLTIFFRLSICALVAKI